MGNLFVDSELECWGTACTIIIDLVSCMSKCHYPSLCSNSVIKSHFRVSRMRAFIFLCLIPQLLHIIELFCADFILRGLWFLFGRIYYLCGPKLQASRRWTTVSSIITTVFRPSVQKKFLWNTKWAVRAWPSRYTGRFNPHITVPWLTGWEEARAPRLKTRLWINISLTSSVI